MKRANVCPRAKFGPIAQCIQLHGWLEPGMEMFQALTNFYRYRCYRTMNSTQSLERKRPSPSHRHSVSGPHSEPHIACCKEPYHPSKPINSLIDFDNFQNDLELLCQLLPCDVFSILWLALSKLVCRWHGWPIGFVSWCFIDYTGGNRGFLHSFLSQMILYHHKFQWNSWFFLDLFTTYAQENCMK